MIKQGEDMKKIMILCFLFVIIGFILGNKIDMKDSIPEKYYFLQEGVYDNDSIMNANLTNLKQKVMEYKNNKFYIYVGITKNKEIADKIMKMYENHLQMEEVWLNNEEFRINVEQLDLLVKKSSSLEEVMKIEEVALASYEEILKTRE